MPTAAAACEKLSAQIISLFICEQVLYSTFALTGGTDDTPVDPGTSGGGDDSGAGSGSTGGESGGSDPDFE